MVGHEFYKSLGRTKLRPGGGVGTKWLFSTVDWHTDIKILEVACNQGANLIDMANDYGVSPIGIDIDTKALDQTKENIELLGFEDKITLKEMDAMDLDFEDNSLDLIINEAMLTMYKNEDKERVLKEYYRILKDGGQLLTHDVCLTDQDELSRRALSRNINLSVYPQTKESWITLMESCKFKDFKIKTGPMLLIDSSSLIKDEGPILAAKIVARGLREENRERFTKMRDFFETNLEQVGHILISSRK